jgi:zinc/manganese transport system substrate-binding protein
MRRRELLALPVAAPALAAGGLLSAGVALLRSSAAQPTGTDGLLPVVASFSVLGDMARHIGGQRVAVRAIAGPEADAHGFQPRPSDVEVLRAAALMLRNGLGFDPWLDRLVRAAGPRGPVVAATEGIEPRGMEARHRGHEHGGGAARRQQHYVGPRRVPDPHAWQDLRLGQVYVRNIAAGLAAADPAGAEVYRRNAQGYAARLAALDGWVRQQIGAVPEARRKVVTTHDAFGYFGAAYGVVFLAPQGVSAETEPSAAEVARLIRQIRAEGITAVFLENTANPALLERLAREAGVRVLGRLYADALSDAGGPAPTYEAMFRHNVSLLVPAMRGGVG